MYRTSSFITKVTKTSCKLLHRVCNIDQFNAQPFNKGSFGWSRNTISAMAHAVNYSEFLALAQQIAKSPRQFNLPDKCSFKDAIAYCRPRMCQSPYELDMYAQQLAQNDFDNLNAQYLKNIQNTQNVVKDNSKPVANE